MNLPDTHTHSGAAGDGRRIHIKDVLDSDRYLFIPATDFEETDANVAMALLNSFAVLNFTDAATGIAATTFMLPSQKKSISRMQLLFYNQSVSTNLRLTFNFELAREGIANRTDVELATSYATGSLNNSLDSIDVPKTAWSGLLQLNPFDVIGFKLTRSGADANDTYNADLKIFGLLVEFN